MRNSPIKLMAGLWIIAVLTMPSIAIAETGTPINVSQQLMPNTGYDSGDYIRRYLSTTTIPELVPTIPFAKGDILHFKASIDQGTMCLRIEGPYNYGTDQPTIAYEAVNRTSVDYQWTVPDTYTWMVEIYNSGLSNATVTLSVERVTTETATAFLGCTILVLIAVVAIVVIVIVVKKVIHEKQPPTPYASYPYYQQPPPPPVVPYPQSSSTSPPSTQPPNSVFCGNCGKPVISNNKFCPSCGAPRS